MSGPLSVLNFLHLPCRAKADAVPYDNQAPCLSLPKKEKRRNRRQPVSLSVFSQPDVKNLPKSFQEAFHPPPAGFISPSPTLSIRTLVCSPVIKSSSSGSSTGLSSSSPSSSSETSLPHCPLRGRSPTKYTRTSGTSASSAVRSSSAGENVMRS